ncbi:MAPEG family protein [Rhodovulum sp. YNF3179]|uniref:MAPEG family protein n=1 Tax=Rhodovulum sp. YNF3179 TaxID=3425127 RepID=UPI003D33ADA1
MLNDELSILALYGLYVAITLVLQATGAMQQLGMGYLLSSRDEGRTASGMAARLERALWNSVSAMALFAPAVLILEARGAFSDATLMAAQVFLIARVIYVPTYAFGVIGVRSLAWAAGFFATIILYLLAL